MVKIDYLAIGDELLDGRVLNKNLIFISNELQRLGLSCSSSMTVSDDSEDIKNACRFYFGHSDVLFITGGLGPTDDDRTSAVLAEFIQEPLVQNKDVLKRIKQFFKDRNRPYFNTNDKQSFFS